MYMYIYIYIYIYIYMYMYIHIYRSGRHEITLPVSAEACTEGALPLPARCQQKGSRTRLARKPLHGCHLPTFCANPFASLPPAAWERFRERCTE